MDKTNPIFLHSEPYQDCLEGFSPEQLDELNPSILLRAEFGHINDGYRIVPSIPLGERSQERPGTPYVTSDGYLICSDGTPYKLELHEQMMHRAGLMDLEIMDRRHNSAPRRA